MNTKPKKAKKVKVTLSITKEAQDIMLDNGYASSRTMGDFVSKLIMDYHARRLADLVTVSPPDTTRACGDTPSRSD